MALYRCSACGSPNVVIDTQKEGYDYLKGAIGTVLLGAGGAAAGINAKNKQVFKCPDCGLTLSESMSFEIKTMIDIGVSCPSARNTLKLSGVPVSWDYFTRKYKNIEKDTIPTISNEVNNSSQNASETSTSKLSNSNPQEISKNISIFNVSKFNYINARNNWAKECRNIQEAEKAKLSAELLKLEEEATEKTKVAQDALQTQLENLSKTTKNNLQEIEKFKNHLAQLSFFSFKEKKVTKNKIENLTNLVVEANEKKEELQNKFNENAKKIQVELQKSKENVKKTTSKITLPLKPERPQGMLDYDENGNETSRDQRHAVFLQEDIFRFIEKNVKVSLKDIMDGPMLDLPHTRTQNFIDILVKDCEIIKTADNNYRISYREISNWYIPKIDDDDIAVYDQYMSEVIAKKEEQTKKNNDIRSIIETVMVGNGPMTIDEIKNSSQELSGIPNPQIMVLLIKLADEGVVNKTEIMRKKYYEWKK